MCGNGVCDAYCLTDHCEGDKGDCVPVPDDECAPGCPWHLINDGTCEEECNNEQCGFDGHDCDQSEPEPAPGPRPEPPVVVNPPSGDWCSPGCPWTSINDGFCDTDCFNETCGHDGHDCDEPEVDIPEPIPEVPRPTPELPCDDCCSTGCAWTSINDGFCDTDCFNEKCGHDGHDCDEPEVGVPEPIPELPTEPEEEFCSPGCPWFSINDGFCDTECYSDKCGFDGYDCDDKIEEPTRPSPAPEVPCHDCCSPGCPWTIINDGICNEACNNEKCGNDGHDCDPIEGYSPSPTEPVNGECSPGCAWISINNGTCDPACQNEKCGQDGHDCDTDTKPSFLMQLFSMKFGV